MYTEYLANALGLRLVDNAVGGATTGAYNNSVLNVIGSFPDPRRCQPPGSPPGCPAQVCASPLHIRLCFRLRHTVNVAAQGERFPCNVQRGHLLQSKAYMLRYFTCFVETP